MKIVVDENEIHVSLERRAFSIRILQSLIDRETGVGEGEMRGLLIAKQILASLKASLWREDSEHDLLPKTLPNTAEKYPLFLALLHFFTIFM
jgi:hypothetical protein